MFLEPVQKRIACFGSDAMRHCVCSSFKAFTNFASTENNAHISVSPFKLQLELIWHLGENAKPPEADDASRGSEEGKQQSTYPKLAVKTCKV